jgi:hypothetical protein
MKLTPHTTKIASAWYPGTRHLGDKRVPTLRWSPPKARFPELLYLAVYKNPNPRAKSLLYDIDLNTPGSSHFGKTESEMLEILANRQARLEDEKNLIDQMKQAMMTNPLRSRDS